jgi:hypothetical protein
MTEDDVENQIIEMDKRDIEHQGIIHYKQQQLVLYNSNSYEDLPDKVKIRIGNIEKWANEKGFIEPKWKDKIKENEL